MPFFTRFPILADQIAKRHSCVMLVGVPGLEFARWIAEGRLSPDLAPFGADRLDS